MSKARAVVAGVAAALAVGLLLHTLLYSDAWSHRARVRSDLDGIVRENQALEERVEHLRNDIAGLRARPEVQERYVRHELGHLRPGEVIVELGESN